MSQAAIDQFYAALADVLNTMGMAEMAAQVPLRIKQGIYFTKQEHAKVLPRLEQKLNWPAEIGEPTYPTGNGGWDLAEGGYVSVVFVPKNDGTVKWREVDSR